MTAKATLSIDPIMRMETAGRTEAPAQGRPKGAK